MKTLAIACIAAALSVAVPVRSEDMATVWVPSGRPIPSMESANKRLALAYWREFWDEGKFDSWPKYMTADFINHDTREPPRGAADLVAWLGERNKEMQARTARGDLPAGAPPRISGLQAQLFVIADGDLVFVAHSMGVDINDLHGKDPGRTLVGNVVRISQGRIAEWWFVGGGAPAAPDPAVPDVQPGSAQLDLTRGNVRSKRIDGTLVLYDSGSASVGTREANKALVLAWLKDFWGDQNFDHWPRYMTSGFRNHDPREPAVGAQALVDWLRAQMSAHPDLAPNKGASGHPHLFLMAEGDLVFIAGSPSTDRGFDPTAQIGGIAGNVIRVHQGRIAEWWYVGEGTDAPPPGT